MTQPDQTRVPTPEETNAGKQVYISFLERRVLYYTLRDLKMRSALELATGVPYDAVDFSNLTFGDIQELISQDMARGLNISLDEARRRVAENKIMSNPEQ